MTARKPGKPHKKPVKEEVKSDVIHVPFPAKDLAHLPVLADVPSPVEPTKEPDDFKVECIVSSIGARFWSGTVFVALEATDGQDLLNLLRNGQKVVVHYQKPSEAV